MVSALILLICCKNRFFGVGYVVKSVRPVHINRVQFFTGRACASVEVALEAWDSCGDVIWTSMRLGGNPAAEVPRYRNIVEFRFNN